MDGPEIELKFEVSDDALTALGKHPALRTPPHTSRLRSTYFDTPGRDLRNACLGLRVRESEDGLVQTLKWEKQPSSLTRHEWEAAVPSKRPDRAALVDTPAAKVLDRHGRLLEPVFTTTVDRTRRVWRRAENVVEVSVDCGDITCGTQREPIQELELELKAGDPQALFELATALAKRVKLTLMFESKAERGYHLADDSGWQPEHAQPMSIAAATPAGDAFRDVARSCLAQVANNARLVCRHRSLEGLHQLRVGLRRFRAALTTFRSFAADHEYEWVRAETQWLARELDTARDLDVFIFETFCCVKPEASDREAFAKLGAQLLRAQSKAYDQALKALASQRFARLMLTTTRWLEIGAWTRSEESKVKNLREGRTDEFARNQLNRMHRQVRRRGRRFARLDAQERHRLRIKVKKLRYAIEFFSESFARPKLRKQSLKALRDLQDGLGRLHDAVVGRHLVLGLVRGKSAKARVAAGLVAARCDTSARKAEQATLRAFQKFEAVKRFWR